MSDAAYSERLGRIGRAGLALRKERCARPTVSRELRGFFIFPVRTSHDDLERIVRQRPLQRLCFISASAQPDLPLLGSRENDRHSLGMHRLDHGVRRGRQKSINKMRPWNGF